MTLVWVALVSIYFILGYVVTYWGLSYMLGHNPEWGEPVSLLMALWPAYLLFVLVVLVTDYVVSHGLPALIKRRRS